MIEPTESMLDLAFFQPGALEDTPPGALFVPAVEGGEHFLSGRLNDFPMLVGLDGDNSYRVASPEQWPRSLGLIVETIRFQVDKASAFRISQAQDAPHGALLLSRHGAMIVAYDQDGSKAVLLEGGSGSTEIDGADAVAFTGWQIVAGHENNVVMYRSGRKSR